MIKDTIIVKKYVFNEKEYYVVNELDYQNKHYVCLSNKNDSNDMMIRIVKEDKLFPLESENELQEVLKMIIK